MSHEQTRLSPPKSGQEASSPRSLHSQTYSWWIEDLCWVYGSRVDFRPLRVDADAKLSDNSASTDASAGWPWGVALISAAGFLTLVERMGFPIPVSTLPCPSNAWVTPLNKEQLAARHSTGKLHNEHRIPRLSVLLDWTPRFAESAVMPAFFGPKGDSRFSVRAHPCETKLLCSNGWSINEFEFSAVKNTPISALGSSPQKDLVSQACSEWLRAVSCPASILSSWVSQLFQFALKGILNLVQEDLRTRLRQAQASGVNFFKKPSPSPDSDGLLIWSWWSKEIPLDSAEAENALVAALRANPSELPTLKIHAHPVAQHASSFAPLYLRIASRVLADDVIGWARDSPALVGEKCRNVVLATKELVRIALSVHDVISTFFILNWGSHALQSACGRLDAGDDVHLAVFKPDWTALAADIRFLTKQVHVESIFASNLFALVSEGANKLPSSSSAQFLNLSIQWLKSGSQTNLAQPKVAPVNDNSEEILKQAREQFLRGDLMSAHSILAKAFPLHSYELCFILIFCRGGLTLGLIFSW